MLNVMRSPVSGEAHAHHTVQRHRSAVHDGFTQLVIVQVLDQLRRCFNDSAQQRLTEAVLYRRVAVSVEIMLQCMGHDVYHPVNGLIARQSEGILGI
ncbi:hypothetical protein D3C75_1087980 [compost metagenome]